MIKEIKVDVPRTYEPGDQATLPVTVTLDIPIGEIYSCLIGINGDVQVYAPASHVANTVHGYLKYIIPNSAKGDEKISVTAYIKKGSQILEKKTVFVTLPVNAKAQNPEKLYFHINLDGLNNPRNVTLQKNPTTLRVTVRPTQSGTMKVIVERSSLGTVIADMNFYANASIPKTIELSVEFPSSGKYNIKIKQKVVKAGVAKYRTIVSWPVTVTVLGTHYETPTVKEEPPENPGGETPETVDIEKESTKEMTGEKVPEFKPVYLGIAAGLMLLGLAYVLIKR